MAAYGHLAGAWLRSAARVQARGDVSGAGAALLAAWAEPHRVYHGLGHLDDVLRQVDDLAGHAGDPDAVRLAAWFHDAVYDPVATDNEQRSAERAEQVLAALDVDPERIASIARLVRLTANHDPSSGDRDGEVLCDADLAVLASAPDHYTAYADRIRTEYAQVPDAEFAAGRAAVLRRLLARPQLYRTPAARSWEQRARDNVTAELRRWEDACGDAGPSR